MATPMMQKVDSLRATKVVPAFQRKRCIAQAVIEDMKRRGRFLREEEGGRLYWFEHGSRRVLELGRDKVAYLLERNYGLNASEAVTGYVEDSLETVAALDGGLVVVHKLAHWDGSVCTWTPATVESTSSMGNESWWVKAATKRCSSPENPGRGPGPPICRIR